MRILLGGLRARQHRAVGGNQLQRPAVGVGVPRAGGTGGQRRCAGAAVGGGRGRLHLGDGHIGGQRALGHLAQTLLLEADRQHQQHHDGDAARDVETPLGLHAQKEAGGQRRGQQAQGQAPAATGHHRERAAVAHARLHDAFELAVDRVRHRHGGHAGALAVDLHRLLAHGAFADVGLAGRTQHGGEVEQRLFLTLERARRLVFRARRTHQLAAGNDQHRIECRQFGLPALDALVDRSLVGASQRRADGIGHEHRFALLLLAGEVAADAAVQPPGERQHDGQRHAQAPQGPPVQPSHGFAHRPGPVRCGLRNGITSTCAARRCCPASSRRLPSARPRRSHCP